MSTKPAKGQPVPAPAQAAARVRVHRLNLRALAILGALLVIAVPATIGYLVLRSRTEAKSLFLEQAKEQVKAGHPELAIKYINRHLESVPEDVEALRWKGELLAKAPRGIGEVDEAIRVSDMALRLAGQKGEADSPENLDVRRRLADLYLAKARIPQAGEPPYGAAVEVANQIIERAGKAAQAGDYRRRAMAREGFVQQENPALLLPIVDDYETALQLDPKDLESAEHLARLYHRFGDRLKPLADAPEEKAKKDRSGYAWSSELVLDRLVKKTEEADPTRKDKAALARAYLSKYRTLADQEKIGPASEALKEARELDPKNREILLASARASLQANETAEAKKYLSALSEDDRATIEARMLAGALELQNNELTGAIEAFRQGLIASSGSDADLTFWLAYVYLQLGRVDQAQPLLDQFRRLVGDEKNPQYVLLDAFKDLKADRPAQTIEKLEPVLGSIVQPLRPQALFLLGQAHQARYESNRDNQSELEAALQAYERAAQAAGRWSAPRIAAISLLQAAKDDNRAEAMVRDTITNAKGTDTKVDASVFLAAAEFEFEKQEKLPPNRRNFDTVREYLNSALKAEPNSARVLLTHAKFLAATQGVDKALAELSKALEDKARPFRENGEVWSAYALALGRLGRSADGLKALDDAAKIVGDQVGLRIARTRLLTQRGEGREARRQLVAGLEKFKADDQIRVWRALLELELEYSNRTGAIEAAEQWARLAPAEPQPVLLLLDLAMANGDEAKIQEQIDRLRDARFGGPTGTYASIARAHELLRRGRLDSANAEARGKAYEEFDQLVDGKDGKGGVTSLNPRLASLLRGLGAEQRNERDKAIQAYKDAYKNGAGQLALSRLTRLLVAAGRADELAELKSLVSAAGGSVNIQALAQATLMAGDRDRARQLAQEVLEGRPDSLEVAVWAARMFNTMGSPEQAESALRGLIRSQPTELGSWIALLAFQVQSNRPPDDLRRTIEQIQAQVKLPDESKRDLMIAQCYRLAARGQHGEFENRAGELFRKALETSPNDPATLQAAADFFDAIGQDQQAEDSVRKALARAGTGQQDDGSRWAARKLALMLSSRQGDITAWNEARQLVEKLPEPATPEDRIVRALVFARGYSPVATKDAINQLEALAADVPADQPIGEQARALLVDLLLNTKQPEKAIDYAAALANRGNQTRAISQYAEALLATGKLDEAGRQLDRLGSLDPVGLRTAELRARLFAAQGQMTEAVDALRKAADAREKAGADDDIVRIVSTLIAIGQFEPAVEIATQLAGRRPDLRHVLGEAQLAAGKVDDVAATLETALRDESPGAPEEARRLVSLAERSLMQAKSSELLERFDAVLTAARERKKDDADLALLLAQLRHQQGRFEEEVSLYRDVDQRLKPRTPVYLNNLAWTLCEELDQPKDALPYIEKAIEGTGSIPAILDTKGVILTRLGETKKAIELLETATQAQPTPNTFFHLARAYKRDGDDAKARAATEQARQLKLDPTQLGRREKAEWDELEALATPAGS